MKRTITLSCAALLIGTAAFAAGNAQLMSSVPSSSLTVTDWYKQDIYNPSNTKIGEIMRRAGRIERPGERRNRRRGRLPRRR